jgi:hypothetical protein
MVAARWSITMIRKSVLPCFVSSALLVLAGLGAARAEEKVLVPGDPPLTQGMVDDYCGHVAWRWPQAFARVGGSQRLGQLVVNDWKNGDKARQRAILADVKWWREDFPKLAQAERVRLAARNEAPGLYVESMGPAPGSDARVSARDVEAIHRARLQQWHDARQREIRSLSNLQASHHENMLLIIDNMRPSGRYEYNPSTGRYDRYVPYPSRR